MKADMSQQVVQAKADDDLLISIPTSIRDDARAFLERSQSRWLPSWFLPKRHQQARMMVSELHKVLGAVPAGAQSLLFEKIARRNRAAIWWSTKAMRKRFEEDLARAAELANAIHRPKENFSLLIKDEFISISKGDTWRVIVAVAIQLIAVGMIYRFREDKDWILVWESLALLLATFLVAKCKTLNQDIWNYILTAAGLFAAASAIIVVLSK